MILKPSETCAGLDAAALKAIDDAFQYQILQWALGHDIGYPVMVTHEGVEYSIASDKVIRLKSEPMPVADKSKWGPANWKDDGWGTETWFPKRTPGTAHLTDEEMEKIRKDAIFSHASRVRDNEPYSSAHHTLGGKYYVVVPGSDFIMTKEEWEAEFNAGRS